MFEGRTVVQLVHVDDTGDSYYRMRWPAMELAALEPTWSIVNIESTASERFTLGFEADLLIVFPVPDLELLPLIKARSAAGKKTLLELNDNFYEPQRWSPIVEGWSSPAVWYAYEKLVEVVDGVIVTGESLREIFAAKFPNTKFYILQNHLHDSVRPLSESLNRKPQSGIILGWGGSLGHIADFIWSVPMLHRLLEKMPQLSVHLMGNSSIPDLARLPPDRFTYVPWGTLHEYYGFLESLHVGYVPALDTPYNRGRSDIKAIEMISLGTMPVLPAIASYRQLIERVQLKSWSNEAELENLLLYYLQNTEARENDLRRCYEYVVKERLAANRMERRDLYASHMPEDSCITPSWNTGAGYHFMQGTPEAVSRSASAIKEANELAKKGHLQEANKVVSEAIKNNPWSPDLAYLFLKIAYRNKDPDLQTITLQYSNMFPTDARFPVFAAGIATNKEERNKIWQKFIDTAECQREPLKKSALTCSLDLFCQHAKDLQIDFNVMQKFLDVYSECAQLRFVLADVFERLGKTSEARQCYGWLDEKLAEFNLNQKFMATLQPKYVAGWLAALDARLAN